ncbi:metallophosphoesterase [Desulfoluna butyratoxydans]|uniref:Metallo-dependent phosphatase-like n=1 Tax=Desulfoluna butyratoxydans TaxID=231438 RepID=A0A4V6ILF9_9BACT|nr:metallophosphoesterase [Desulfoluna butyratoxydans]VFQ44908.1 metallo-dependent phosphatase-like [Desulfoluna butyratoxydans]
MAIEKNVNIKNNQKYIVSHEPCDAKILYPSLGCPSLVKIEGDNAWVEMVVACKNNGLCLAEVAFHLRYVEWGMLHGDKKQNSTIGDRSRYKMLDLYKKYFLSLQDSKNSTSLIRISEAYFNADNRINVENIESDNFQIQLAHMNAFPWVLEMYKKEGYTYLYKIAVNLKYEPGCCTVGNTGKLLNFIWLEKELYEKSKGKPSLMEIETGWYKDLLKKEKKEVKTRLSEFGGDVAEAQDVLVKLYHPVYISKKNRLSIGHITDIHLDTRMELYSKSVASVIEVKENCQVRIKDDKRVVENDELYQPIKNLVANFNQSFTSISGKLLSKADALVVTGDLIDFNKGIHTDQTFSDKDKTPSKVWEELKAEWFSLDNENHLEDRNWFLFYKLLVELYTKHGKPIFTMLGNHDYVKHAMAPWPVFGLTWNGVYDMNLTRYENALCFGKGYNGNKEFVFNSKTSSKCVEWYTFFINPFPDYVIDYGDQSMFMVDWGEGANISRIGGIDDVTKNLVGKKVPLRHPGSLHHAANLFREKNEYEKPLQYKDKQGNVITVKIEDEDGNEVELTDPYRKKKMPFLVKNFTIYKSWINRPAAVRMLFTHATVICPKDNVTVGEINNDYSWKEPELCYGTFDYRRDEVIKDVENGKLHIAVGGHSHRNLVMKVGEKKKDHATVLAAGERIRTEFIEPEHIAMVTSSGGPFPKYLPGAPMICACFKENKYNTGFYCERDFSLKELHTKQLYSGQDDSKKEAINSNECPHCHMQAGDMVRKPAKRHRPGGNLLIFDDTGKLKIQSVVTDDKKNKPRKAVMCEEQKIFIDDMKLEDINSYEEFSDWDETEKPIQIISTEPFTYYGYMEFPSRVKYITFKTGVLPGDSAVQLVSKEYSNKFFKFVQESVFDNIYEKRVVQEIGKKCFRKLKNAATHESDFAFVRYSFNELDFWDREINIGKQRFEDVKEYAKIKTNNAFEASKEWLAEKFEKTYNPQYQEYIKDDFRGMLLEFRIIPDFEKRKDNDVCGY